MELSGSSLESVGTLVGALAVPLLQVRNLSVYIPVNTNQELCAIKDVNFDLRPGEVLGVLGESGAGKTTLGLALLGLLPSNFRVTGSLESEGVPILSLGRTESRKLRGRRVSVIYQDSSVLNPVLRIGTQLTEILRAHENWSRQECRDRAIALLEAVEFRDADRIFAAFPHQLSGGQRQRVVIAQALAGRPSLIIADEPTSSLDGAVTAEILELLVGLKRRFHTSFLLISHDVGVLEVLADEIMVMYCGRIVEQGSRHDILQRPLHPYTRALLACTLPGDNDLTPGSDRRPAPMIPASFGPMRTWRGCDFECRCPDRMAVCAERVPDQLEVSAARTVRCFKFGG